MTEKDFMIGDWVRFRYSNEFTDGEVVCTFRITQIENMCRSYYVWSDDDGRVCHPEQLEGVPLTREIVKKNKLEDWVYFLDEMPIFSLKLAGDATIRGVAMPFVHDLQHLLRICGFDNDLVLD